MIKAAKKEEQKNKKITITLKKTTKELKKKNFSNILAHVKFGVLTKIMWHLMWGSYKYLCQAT